MKKGERYILRDPRALGCCSSEEGTVVEIEGPDPENPLIMRSKVMARRGHAGDGSGVNTIWLTADDLNEGYIAPMKPLRSVE
jgi:hypothetical protein